MAGVHGEKLRDGERPIVDKQGASAQESSTQEEFKVVLKRLREARGYNQITLAERMHRSSSLLSLLESGQRHPTRKFIEELSSALHLSESEKLLLLRSAGYSEDALGGFIQTLVASIDRQASLDEADRTLLFADLMKSMSGWKALFDGRKQLHDGNVARAREQFEEMLQHTEYSPTIQAYVRTSMAEVYTQQSELEKGGRLCDEASDMMASWPKEWATQLRAETAALRGSIALRNGLYPVAERLTEGSAKLYREMLFTSDTTETNEVIARQGLGKSYKRLAQVALFKGDPQAALGYCIEAEVHLRDMRGSGSSQWWERRIRELKGWAYSELGQVDRAVESHRKALQECEKVGETDGVTKNWLYLGDDYRRALTKIVDEYLAQIADSGRDINTPEQRRAAVREALASQRSLLDEADRCYREAFDRVSRMPGKLLLGRCRRSRGIIWYYQAVLDDSEGMFRSAEEELQIALQIDRELGQKRRLPSIYGSLIDLLWLWGRVGWQEQVLHYIDMAIDVLDLLPVNTLDPASEKLRERLEGKRVVVQRMGVSVPDRAYASGKWARLLDLQGSDQWKAVCTALLETVRKFLASSDVSACIGSDRNTRWVSAMCDMELQPGPRILAQNDLSYSLSLLSRGGFVPDEMMNRHLTLHKQVVAAHDSSGSERSRDVCCGKTVERTLRESFSRALVLDQIKNALAWMTDHPEGYALVSSLYELPLGFAAKGEHILLEIPYAVARVLLDQQIESSVDEGKICYHLVRGKELNNEQFTLMREELTRLFEQFVSIAKADREKQRAGTTQDWLSSIVEHEAEPIQRIAVCDPAL